jgi:Ca-activated chloride channel family protein
VKRLCTALLAALALPASAHAQDGKPVVGGGSFNTAPLLAPGKYADTVAAGETVYWKVKLAKGQILKARATVDVSQIETDYSAADYLPGLYHLDYDLSIFTPLREPLAEELGAGYEKASTELEGDDSAGAKTGEAEGPRVLGYEQILAGDYDVSKFPAPGEWYIGLSVADSSSEPAEQPVELPVDLEITVDGAAQASSPDFVKDLATPTPEPTEEPIENASQLLGGEADAGNPALTILLVAVLALLGGLGLGALAARVLPRS